VPGACGRLTRALALRTLAALGTAWLLAGPAAQAGTLRYCDSPPALSAAQQDRLLRVSGIIKDELERSGTRVALVARSGLNLRWFDMRYSHAGLSLRGSSESRWAVRQLYFSCDDQQPRIFDQGLSAFLLGTEDPSLGYLSVVLLPEAAAAALEPVALDNRQALSLLSPHYSANAYTWSLSLQNCNQWLAELLALAWGGPATQAQAQAEPRAAAQGWLRAQGYQGAQFNLGWRPLLWLTAFSPWLHLKDHPETDLAQARLVVSMPASLEALVRSQAADAERVEFCHTDRHVVVRRGWEPLADGCVPGAQDRVVLLD
jgi:hypothetical protein